MDPVEKVLDAELKLKFVGFKRDSTSCRLRLKLAFGTRRRNVYWATLVFPRLRYFHAYGIRASTVVPRRQYSRAYGISRA